MGILLFVLPMMLFTAIFGLVFVISAIVRGLAYIKGRQINIKLHRKINIAAFIAAFIAGLSYFMWILIDVARVDASSVIFYVFLTLGIVALIVALLAALGKILDRAFTPNYDKLKMKTEEIRAEDRMMYNNVIPGDYSMLNEYGKSAPKPKKLTSKDVLIAVIAGSFIAFLFISYCGRVMSWLLQ